MLLAYQAFTLMCCSESHFLAYDLSAAHYVDVSVLESVYVLVLLNSVRTVLTLMWLSGKASEN